MENTSGNIDTKSKRTMASRREINAQFGNKLRIREVFSGIFRIRVLLRYMRFVDIYVILRPTAVLTEIMGILRDGRRGRRRQR